MGVNATLPWFGSFVVDHLRRNRHSGFPDARTAPIDFDVFFDAWKVAFERHKVTEAEVTRASTWMATQPPEFPDGHLNALLSRINSRRAQAAVDASAARRQEILADRAREVEVEAASLEVWRSLPEARREQIRAAVVRDYPVLEVMRNERYTTLICLAELHARLGSEGGGT